MTFGWTDPDGIVLTAEPSATIGGACRIELEDPEGGTRLRPGDGIRVCAIVPQPCARQVAAGMAAAVHEAAGLPAPVILERPDWRVFPGSVVDIGGVDVGLNSCASRPVTLAIRGVSQHLEPDTARRVAVHLAARADQAEADAGARDLLELASVISAAGPGEDGRRAARAVLALYEIRERAA